MSDLIAYKSNALVEASYKLTLQEQRFLLLCISRLKSGALLNCKDNDHYRFAEYFDSFPDIGRKNAEVQLQEASIVYGTGRIILKNDERREEVPLDQYRAQYALKDLRPRLE